ncbi:hypothetical protein BKA69DRAFT_1105751 [Paraphysoderma sedebokerense]|nr:hypothetical protein BKA69DRAFT_1105751 [Paraphysoderma sedebokerense]
MTSSINFYLPHEIISASSSSMLNDDDDEMLASESHIVTPGETITNDMAFMRGHGTFLDEEELVASVCGVVDRVNKLVVVRPLRSRFIAEIGDVVVGRITEVAQKRWKVDINSRLDAILNLSSVSLPGGVQRRKSESDELQMRKLLSAGDVVVAEIQSFFSDGSIGLHTRSVKYGKLRNGSFVSVASSLVKRCKSHFHSLPCGVDVILGLNGYIWVSKHVEDREREEGRITREDLYGNKNEVCSVDVFDFRYIQHR